jgi:mRNA-degrading endonuclease RelE of RelBE toxin-antitoxin system
VTPDFEIVWKKSAAKELRGLDQTVRARVMSAIAALENDPYPLKWWYTFIIRGLYG